MCRAGRYNLCPDVRFFGTPPIDGAFCEYVVLATDFAYRVPDSMSDDAAGLLEPLSVAVWANRKARTRVGSSLLVTGAGPIGLLVVQVAVAAGAADVVVSDVDLHRRELVLRFGATAVLDPASAVEQLSAETFIDCSGVAPAVTTGLSSLRPGGTAVLVGMGADEVPLPVSLLQDRELTITGTFRYANTWTQARLNRGRFDTGHLMWLSVARDAPDRPGPSHVASA